MLVLTILPDGSLTIPAAALALVQLSPGDTVRLSEDSGRLFITSERQTPPVAGFSAYLERMERSPATIAQYCRVVERFYAFLGSERRLNREATLDYTVLAKTDALTLVKVRLHTRRTHQIRVQFSHRGLPLLGDIRYGSKADCSAALWSYHLSLAHPVTGQTVDVTCPPPAAYPWDLFRQGEEPRDVLPPAERRW